MLKQRIAFICPSKSWGGLEMNVLRISLWLNRRGHNILLYCDTGYELSTQAKLNNVETRELSHSSKIIDLLQTKKLSQSFQIENIQLALFHLNSNFLMMALTKLFSKNKFSLFFMQHMHLGGTKKDFMHNYIYKQLDCWIAPLEMFAKRLTEISNIPKSKIKVIPFGIELEKFIHCSVTQKEARQKLNLPIDTKIVGFIGRLDPKKCQHLLIEATHILKKKNIHLDVLFVGDSTKNEELVYKQELEKLIEKYDLQKQIHFRPHISKVEIAFKALDIFCLTTGSETFGMVTIEAMASRLAVIGSNDGGTSEIIRHEKNGLLYQSGNSSEIAFCIQKLLDDPVLKENIAQQAISDAQQNYAHKTQCDALENLFAKELDNISLL